MPTVTFFPMNRVIEAPEGETLLSIALQEGLPIQHACGGFCACTTCHLWVQSGAENLSPPDDEELDRLDSIATPEHTSRLACQSRIKGDVVVEIVNLEE